MSEKTKQDECDLTEAMAEAAEALEAKIDGMRVRSRFPKKLAPASEDYVSE